MAHALTLGLIGGLALAGVGAGIHLGHSAIGEINPVYFKQPETRFHADLSPNPPSGEAPPITLARAGDPALGTGCIGCRTYPEEYYPIHEASLERYSSGYATDTEAATPAVAEPEQADPERLRLREDMIRVERYARGGEGDPVPSYASAEAAPDTAEPAGAGE